MPLLVDHPHPGVARLLLDRPERHNALDRALVQALHTAVEAQREHVIVLGSSGPGRFCGGADTSLDDAERAWVSDALYELYARILELPRPGLAAPARPALRGRPRGRPPSAARPSAAASSSRSAATCASPRRVPGWPHAGRVTAS